ncbi:pilus assembly PilX family protein [Paracidovorax sp. MALMAid1276]|uniref:pilus assembly PilX family protein n=1 Tax=Paracidovorax sp. MALMAid1276 TaxID=3411631 RepID=UPI003B9AA40A
MSCLAFYSHQSRRRPQRGVALFVVIVFVMLSMLLALWASRTSLFNEMLVGNDADYQRAFEAAQALLLDAELDIRGENPDGTRCVAATCRDNVAAAFKIPLDSQEVTPLLADLDTETTKCRSGLCTKRTGRQDFWNYTTTTSPAPTNLQPGEVRLDQMTQPAVGARYGQYSGAAVGTTTTPANPILQWDATTPNNQGGWYWVEIMPYDESSKNSGLITTSSANLLSLNLKPNVAYRITALAYGRKPGTMAVLQQTYVRQLRKD